MVTRNEQELKVQSVGKYLQEKVYEALDFWEIREKNKMDKKDQIENL